MTRSLRDTQYEAKRSRATDIPAIFIGADIYEYTIEDLELAQLTFNEAALYDSISLFARDWSEKAQRPARIVDLCSSGGLSAKQVIDVIPVESVALVDIDANALGHAQQNLPAHDLQTYCTDAVTFDQCAPYDLVLMNSAYHHIENERKVQFLQNGAKLLSKDGAIILCDNFLPNYRSRREFQQSVVSFYESLFQNLREMEVPSQVLNVIRKSGFNCWRGIDEYKVSMNHLVCHLDQVRLTIVTSHLVWSCQNGIESDISPGTRAMVIRPKDRVDA